MARSWNGVIRAGLPWAAGPTLGLTTVAWAASRPPVSVPAPLAPTGGARLVTGPPAPVAITVAVATDPPGFVIQPAEVDPRFVVPKSADIDPRFVVAKSAGIDPRIVAGGQSASNSRYQFVPAEPDTP